MHAQHSRKMDAYSVGTVPSNHGRTSRWTSILSGHKKGHLCSRKQERAFYNFNSLTTIRLLTVCAQRESLGVPLVLGPRVSLCSSQSNKRVVRKIVSEKRHPLSFLLSRNRILIRIQNTSLSALQKQEERLLCLVLQMQSCRFTTRSHVHFRPEYSREIIDFSRCRQENKQSLQFFFLR